MRLSEVRVTLDEFDGSAPPDSNTWLTADGGSDYLYWMRFVTAPGHTNALRVNWNTTQADGSVPFGFVSLVDVGPRTMWVGADGEDIFTGNVFGAQNYMVFGDLSAVATGTDFALPGATGQADDETAPIYKHNKIISPDLLLVVEAQMTDEIYSGTYVFTFEEVDL